MSSQEPQKDKDALASHVEGHEVEKVVMTAQIENLLIKKDELMDHVSNLVAGNVTLET